MGQNLARRGPALHGRIVADERDDFEVSDNPEATGAAPASGVGVTPPRKQAGGWADPKQLPRGPNGRPPHRRPQPNPP